MSDGPPLLPPTSFQLFRPNPSSQEIPLALSSEHAGICPLHFPRITPGARGSLPLLSPPTLAACCPPHSSRGSLRTHVGGVATLPPASPSSTGKGEPTLSRPPRPACPALTRHFARPPQLRHFLLALCSSVFLHLARAPQRLGFLCPAL